MSGSSLRDRVRKRAETHKGGNASTVKLPEGVEWFTPRKGSVVLDILPYRVSIDGHPQAKKGELWYERTFFVHRDIGPEKTQVVCPSTFNKPCPVCEEWRKLRKEEGVDEGTVDALRPKERQLFNVIDVDKDPDKVLVWDVSFHLFGKLLEQEVREGDEDNAAFCELTNGKSLKVRFDEVKNGKYTFMEASRIDFVDREDYGDDVLELVTDLDKTLVIVDGPTLSKMFNGGGTDEPAGETREEVPPARSLRRGTKAPPPEEPPPETDEPPAPRRGSRKPPVEEVPEETTEGAERRITWEYKNEEHTGVVVEELEDEAVRVRDDADGKVKFLNGGEYQDIGGAANEETREEPPAPPARSLRRGGASSPPPAANPPVTRRRRIEN